MDFSAGKSLSRQVADLSCSTQVINTPRVVRFFPGTPILINLADLANSQMQITSVSHNLVPLRGDGGGVTHAPKDLPKRLVILLPLSECEQYIHVKPHCR